MDQPLKLAKMFNNFMWLLEDEVDEMLDAFVTTESRNGPITRTRYYQELLRYDSAMTDIQNICFLNEAYIMVNIQIGNPIFQFLFMSLAIVCLG